MAIKAIIKPRIGSRWKFEDGADWKVIKVWKPVPSAPPWIVVERLAPSERVFRMHPLAYFLGTAYPLED